MKGINKMEDFSSHKINIKWFACTTSATELLSSTALNATESQLLFYLLGNIDRNNRVKYESYNKIAESLTASQSAIKKAMMTLRNYEIITKDTNYSKTIFINPQFFYAGGPDLNESKQAYYEKCQAEYKKKQTERKDKLNETMSKNKTKQGRKKKNTINSNVEFENTLNNEFYLDMSDDNFEKITLDEFAKELNNE
jgi:putative rolling circle replication protein